MKFLSSSPVDLNFFSPVVIPRQTAKMDHRLDRSRFSHFIHLIHLMNETRDDIFQPTRCLHSRRVDKAIRCHRCALVSSTMVVQADGRVIELDSSFVCRGLSLNLTASSWHGRVINQLDRTGSRVVN